MPKMQRKRYPVSRSSFELLDCLPGGVKRVSGSGDTVPGLPQLATSPDTLGGKSENPTRVAERKPVKRMPWGKFRGTLLTDIKSYYLIWVVENADFAPQELKDACEQVLCDRYGDESDHRSHDAQVSPYTNRPQAPQAQRPQ